MLSDGDLRGFAETGIVRLPQAFRPVDARSMEEMVWRFLAKSGTSRAEPTSWPARAVPGLSSKVKRSTTFQLAWSDTVVSALDQLLDGDYDPPKHCGAVLVTFPHADQWSVPHRIWHCDTHFMHEPYPLFGLKVYGFINSVGPGQGGTGIVSGSHHLVEHFRRTNPDDLQCKGFLRPFNKSDPWLAELTSGLDDDTRTERLTTPTAVRDHEVSVVELMGEPGDIVITHPYVLHCITANAASAPRMMFSRNIWRHGVEQIGDVHR